MYLNELIKIETSNIKNKRTNNSKNIQFSNHEELCNNRYPISHCIGLSHTKLQLQLVQY
ncbi:hypothetical protein ACHAWC_003100 [Mediolabrus comicus]